MDFDEFRNTWKKIINVNSLGKSVEITWVHAKIQLYWWVHPINRHDAILGCLILHLGVDDFSKFKWGGIRSFKNSLGM